MGEPAAPDPAALERARAVKAAHEDDLMALPNVVAVGVGLRGEGDRAAEEIAIVVSVSRKVPAHTLDPGDRIPAEIDGVPVEVRQTGPLTAGAP